MSLSDILLSIASAILFFPLLSLFILSLVEREKIAARRSLIFSIAVFFLYFPLIVFEFPGSTVVSLILAITTITVLAVILFPFPLPFSRENEEVKERHDERDVIFVRNKLVEGTGRFREYYDRKTDKLETDQKFRRAPGLLSPESTQYDPFMYGSAAATFQVCENLIGLCDGPVSETSIGAEPSETALYIKEWVRQLGAISVGITELKEDHLYSIGGRRERYGKPVTNNHKYAIAFTVEMDRDSMRRGPKAPTIMESAQQYLNSGTIAVQLAAFIRSLGFPARAHIDANYEVICPTVARDAGLGELGRMGLLITPELGPRVRVAVVTTDIPLKTDKRIYDGSVADFCSHCKKCADLCPSKAIPRGDREEDNGVQPWKINHEKCFTYWCRIGTDCGRCVSLCPYSHPDNFIHNAIRFFIRKSPLFRRVGATMDDIFYGRKAKPFELAPWQKVFVDKKKPALKAGSNEKRF